MLSNDNLFQFFQDVVRGVSSSALPAYAQLVDVFSDYLDAARDQQKLELVEHKLDTLTNNFLQDN